MNFRDLKSLLVCPIFFEISSSIRLDEFLADELRSNLGGVFGSLSRSLISTTGVLYLPAQEHFPQLGPSMN